MAKSSELTWSVLPHDTSLTQLEENLWTIEGTIPTVPMPRRMVVVRLQNGSLLLHNAIALNESSMAALTALGDVAWMVVPNGYHRIDAPRYKARFPKLKVICPKGALKKVRQKVAVDMDFDQAEKFFHNDASVNFVHLDGIRQLEGVLKVTSSNGQTLIVNDSIFNLDPMKGLFGLLYGRLMGHAGHIQIPKAFRWVMLKDKQRFKKQLSELAQENNLIRLIPGHGKIIDEQVSVILNELSETL